MIAETEHSRAEMSASAQLGPSARALELMDQLNDQDSPVRKQLCVAVHKINTAIIAEHQRSLTQVNGPAPLCLVHPGCDCFGTSPL